ncbi:MAG: PhoH family protein [Elusimicrobia bacterium]|nr:PhoH family protein [Elusimicrobiota bacterium]
MITRKIKLRDHEQLVRAFGVQDSRLRELERDLKVDFFVRHEAGDGGVEVSIRGSNSRVDKALAAIRQSLGEETPPAKSVVKPIVDGVLFRPQRGKAVAARSQRQAEYVEAIFSKDLVFGIGPAGTGKTYLAVAAALRALEIGLIEKIVLTRPIVEAGENLGYLPGDLYEKVHPYLMPLYDAFGALVGHEEFRDLRTDGVVEIVPLAYMRGRTLENAFMILDEAQNTVPEQMKMFLTRMGMGSRMIVNGDITQVDLKDKKRCGLALAEDILGTSPNVRFVKFGKEDVVRHPLVREILHSYEKWESRGY